MGANSIISGVKWAGIQFVLDVLFRFSIRLILAKLLVPEDFGLIGMCTVFISVAEAASELGMGAALIQRKDDAEVKLAFDTVFWTGLLWGVIVYVLVSFVGGALAATFYKESRLLTVIPFLSLGILIKPIGIIPTVILTRDLNFKSIAKISNFSVSIAGIIAIISAYLGIGIWALIINNVCSVLITIPFLFFVTKWKPNFSWNKVYFKEVFGFGFFSTITSIFSSLTYNVDNVVIGRFLGAAVLGSYSLSFSLTEQLRQMVSGVLNRVMFPVFGKKQDDKKVLKKYFLSIVSLNAILLYPVMSFFYINSEEIILLFFGETWTGAIVPLKMLSIAVMIHLSVNSFTSLIRGLGKPKLEMKIIVGLTFFVTIPLLVIGTKNYGIIGAIYAVLINKTLLVVIALVVLRKEIELGVLELLKAIWAPCLSVFLSAVILCFIKGLGVENIYILALVYFMSSFFMIYLLEKNKINNILLKLKSN